MKISKYIFSSEYDQILKGFLGISDFETLKMRINSLPIKDSVKVASRTKLDLTITFLNSKLKSDEYSKLLYELARHYLRNGELQTAADLFRKSLANLELKNTFSASHVGYSYLRIAEIYAIQASWEDAERYLRKAKAVFKATNNKSGLADTQNFIGTIKAEKGKIISAKKEFENAINTIASTKADEQKSKLYNNLATIQTILGEFEKAKGLYLKALLHFDSELDKKSIAEVKHNLGMVSMKMGEIKEAEKYFNEAINLAEAEAIYPILGISYLGLAEVLIITSNYRQAEEYLGKALNASLNINDRLTAADAYKLNGVILRKKNQFEAAEFMLLTSYRMNQELSNELNLAETSVELALLYKVMHKDSLVKKYFSEAEMYYKKNRCFKDINRMKTLLKNS